MAKNNSTIKVYGAKEHNLKNIDVTLLKIALRLLPVLQDLEKAH